MIGIPEMIGTVKEAAAAEEAVRPLEEAAGTLRPGLANRQAGRSKHVHKPRTQ